jgi:hypothetical protein
VGNRYQRNHHDLRAAVLLRNLKTKMATFFNKLHVFTVDVGHAGPGELTIIVNGGSVPATVRASGRSIYSVSFSPPEAGLYSVELLFNDQPLKGW